MNHSACTVCREAGHSASKCPEVFSDLKWGFYEGASAGGGDGDCDDEHALEFNSVVCGLRLIQEIYLHRIVTRSMDLMQDTEIRAQLSTYKSNQ